MQPQLAPRLSARPSQFIAMGGVYASQTARVRLMEQCRVRRFARSAALIAVGLLWAFLLAHSTFCVVRMLDAQRVWTTVASAVSGTILTLFLAAGACLGLVRAAGGRGLAALRIAVLSVQAAALGALVYGLAYAPESSGVFGIARLSEVSTAFFVGAACYAVTAAASAAVMRRGLSLRLFAAIAGCGAAAGFAAGAAFGVLASGGWTATSPITLVVVGLAALLAFAHVVWVFLRFCSAEKEAANKSLASAVLAAAATFPVVPCAAWLHHKAKR